MVESEANELPEEVMLGAVVFGHQQQQAAIDMIHSLVEEGGKPLWDWKPRRRTKRLIQQGDACRRRRAARGVSAAPSRRASRR
jgi:polyribonucleotide nucleotidyltransferase